MRGRRRFFDQWAAPGARHLVLAFLFPFLLYAPTIGFEYVHADDLDLIARNQNFLGDLTNAPRAFEQSYFETENALTNIKTYYRPLAIVSFMLDAQRAGDDPRAYHLTNVVLHASVSVLLMLLATTWGALPHAALAAALVFAAHPINVQAVAWIAGRNELLLAVFGLISLIAWSRGDEAPRPRAAWIAAHAVAFALALFSKETGILFPVMAVLHQRVARQRRVSRTQWVGLGVDGIIALVWLWLRAEALAGTPVTARTEIMRIALMNSPQLLVQVGKLLVPVRLNVSPGVDAMGLVIGIASVVVLGGVALRLLPRGSTIVATCWVVAFLVPTLVVPGLPAYEHRNYLPLLGVLLAFSAFRPTEHAPRTKNTRRDPSAPRRRTDATGAPPPVMAIAIVCFIVALLAMRTVARQTVFHDAFAYWNDATRDPQFGPIAHVNLGQLHEGAGRFEQARREYVRALEREPATPKANNNLGAVLMKLNEPQLAVRHFGEEVRRHPWNAEAWFNLGLAAELRGDPTEARRHYERAISEDRYFIPAHEKLGSRPPPN